MTDRPCDEWNTDALCVLRAFWDDPKRSLLCKWFDRCMYAAPRSSFSDLELEYLDAWSHRKVCLLAYRPETLPLRKPYRRKRS